MNIDEAFQYVMNAKPKIIHISGKTSTGKTTFARKLHERMNYKIIELDQIVRDFVMEPLGNDAKDSVFIEVYKERNHIKWIQLIVDAVHVEIADAIAKGIPVILDGAIANTETLHDVIDSLPTTVIIYLHPYNLDIYIRYLCNRFETVNTTYNAGLPVNLWKLIDNNEMHEYYKNRVLTQEIRESIKVYAIQSQKSSTVRLKKLCSAFPNTLVVTI